VAKEKEDNFPVGGCQPTFLGRVCRTKQGFKLTRGKEETAITSSDAKELLDGGILSHDDLQAIGKVKTVKVKANTRKKGKTKTRKTQEPS